MIRGVNFYTREEIIQPLFVVHMIIRLAVLGCIGRNKKSSKRIIKKKSHIGRIWTNVNFFWDNNIFECLSPINILWWKCYNICMTLFIRRPCDRFFLQFVSLIIVFLGKDKPTQLVLWSCDRQKNLDENCLPEWTFTLLLSTWTSCKIRNERSFIATFHVKKYCDDKYSWTRVCLELFNIQNSQFGLICIKNLFSVICKRFWTNKTL